MFNNRISKRAILLMSLMIVLFILSFTGCDMLTGEDGLAGPTVYLVDDNGTRIYSGGTIYLGAVAYAGTSTLTENLYLVNDSGSSLTLSTGTKVAMVVETKTDIEYYDWIVVNTTTPNSNLSLDQSLLSAELTNGDTSAAMKFTLTADSGTSFILKRRYLIELTDGIESYNFEFEVYGYFSSGS